MSTIKTYRGRTLADALARVKQDLGPDAVILNTRTYKAGGVLGIGATTVAEIAATTQANAPRRIRPAASTPVAPTAHKAAPMGVRAPAGAPAPVPAPRATAARPSFAEPSAPSTKRPEPVLPAAREVARRVTSDEQVSPPRPDRIEWSARVSDSAPMARELADLKRMVGQVLRSSVHVGLTSSSDALVDAYAKLIGAEVAADLAESVMAKVRAEVPASQHHDAGAVRGAVLRHLAALVQIDDAAVPTSRGVDGRPAVIALIGPTGVGKTTTVAKLAATYRLRHGLRVALITADTYRIAAVDQLRTYANIIGLPLRVVLTPADMRAAVDASANCDVVLIDTAGRAPRDEARLGELRAMLDAARPTQTHLCLSTAASEAVMGEAARCFGALVPSHVILTKLDEAVNFGVLVNLAQRIDAKLSFITTGQEVPDHIEPGDADRVARLVLEGSAAS